MYARLPRVRRAPRRCTRPGSPRCTSPRWCSATPSCRTAAATRSFAEGVAWLAQIGLFVMLGLLLTPSRITLAMVADRPASAGLVLTLLARPVSVLRSARSCSRCRGASSRSSRGPGCAARCRSCWRRSRSPRGSTDAQRALRHRVRDGRDLHAAHRPDPAARSPRWLRVDRRSRAARPRPRGGAARADRRRPAPGDDQPGLAAARRRGRRAPAADRARRSSMVIRDGQTLVPERRTVLQARRRPARRHPARAARGDRARGCATSRAAAARLAQWLAGELSERSDLAAGAQTSMRRPRRRPDALGALDQLARTRRRPRRPRPAPVASRCATTAACGPSRREDQPDAGAARGRRSRSRRSRDVGALGRVADVCPRRSPGPRSCSWCGRPGRPGRWR